MPYAAEGVVSTEALPDGIEISEDQYNQAIEGMCAGLVVTVTDGFKVSAPPEPPPIPEPSEEDLAAMALSQRDGLLAIAAIRIAPLQDAVDLGEATDAEVSLLTEWKVYRVALNRLPEQAGYPNEIDWPVQPS